MLADALRLSLRRGAGPFRSAAHLGVEPRAYQLVPLLMAMRQEVKRLLIADDVGIGKTIEAGMILREMLDRGEIDRFTVLCPPHLVDQWVSELGEKFDLDTVAVTASRARGLERGLPVSQSLFDAYPFTVVSLDYIKSDRRRDDFARSCPELVIVDEAHSCVGGDHGTHQRFELLDSLAADETRHMLFLTATPHSGDQDAYGRLLGLLAPGLEAAPPEADDNALERYRRRLAQHFVQRRRPDIEEYWDESGTFPKHLTDDAPYALTGDFAEFHEDVLDYCLHVTERADGAQARRLAFWGTLALMRCVGSSPAAASSALRNRLGGMAEKEALEAAIFDEEKGLLVEGDVEPGTAVEDREAQSELEKLIKKADDLDARRKDDPKLRELIRRVSPLIKNENANPVIFCRFIATAEAVGEALAAKFKKCRIEIVTGRLTPEERRERVASMGEHERRILVATDCLSEGINLQSLFNAVVHYDLSWNPTRHQQREGRVDRFAQQSKTVWSLMLFGENSMIDGAVLDVITRKARDIMKETGVAVPMPEDSASVSSALMQAMLLRSNNPRAQGAFDFGDAADNVEKGWRDAAEDAKRSRTRYAQRTLSPQEVLPEWKRMRALNGGPEEVERFARRALIRLGAPLESGGPVPVVHFDRLPEAMRERLAARNLEGSRKIIFADHPAEGVMHVGRVHPLIATLAENLSESALDPGGADGIAPLGRAGAWRSDRASAMTTVLLMRLRFTLITSGRANRTLLAEEATALAFSGVDVDAEAAGADALALLEVPATGNIDREVIERRIAQALDRLEGYEGAISRYAAERAERLSEDHVRLTEAARGGATTEVSPVLPADIIGLYVIIPEAN